MHRAVIVGRSAEALAEYAAARALCDYRSVIVVGKTAECFPDRIDHLVSFHVELFDKWVATRAANGHPPPACYWGAIWKGRRLGQDRTRCMPLRFSKSIGGSSGFLATQIALDELGVDRAVLAGMPMESSGRHLAEACTEREVGKPWGEADAYWPTWVESASLLLDRVRSMSGRTRALLGAPTREWLEG